MAEPFPTEIAIEHAPGPQITNAFYTNLTPPNLQSRRIVLPDSIPLTSTLTDLKSILKERYEIPLEIQWGFQRNSYSSEYLLDTMTLGELKRERAGSVFACGPLVLLTVAARVKDIHDSILSVPRQIAHFKAVARYYSRKSEELDGVEKANMLQKVEKFEGKIASALENFTDMISDLDKYTGDGSAETPELSESALLDWLEGYKKNRRERLHRLCAEQHAALKASNLARTETLAEDITEEERKSVKYWAYNYFSTDQRKPLEELGLSYDESSMVLQELWPLLDETDLQPYVSKAVEEKRKSDAFYKEAELAKAELKTEEMEPEEEEDTCPPVRFAFDYPPVNPEDEVVVRPLRNEKDALPETAFTITSGKLLWGQMQTVIAGSRAEGFDGNAAYTPPMIPGGTILKHVYNYRCAARNGDWNVRKAYSGSELEMTEPDFCFGWILHHEDIDPLETVERCSLITSGGGISNTNNHHDKDVLYINRYDWSWLSGNRELVRKVLKEDAGFHVLDKEGLGEWELDDLECQGDKWGGYMMALDAEKYSPSFLETFCKDCPMPRDRPRTATEDTELVFGTKEGGNFGAFLSLVGTEYEFAWFVFSGKKHEKYMEMDELVAIVYDGIYHVLEGDKYAVET